LQVPDLGYNFCTQADGDNINFWFTIFCVKDSYCGIWCKFSIDVTILPDGGILEDKLSCMC
jgi:hypothetical protein